MNDELQESDRSPLVFEQEQPPPPPKKTLVEAVIAGIEY